MTSFYSYTKESRGVVRNEKVLRYLYKSNGERIRTYQLDRKRCAVGVKRPEGRTATFEIRKPKYYDMRLVTGFNVES